MDLRGQTEISNKTADVGATVSIRYHMEHVWSYMGKEHSFRNEFRWHRRNYLLSYL